MVFPTHLIQQISSTLSMVATICGNVLFYIAASWQFLVVIFQYSGTKLCTTFIHLLLSFIVIDDCDGNGYQFSRLSHIREFFPKLAPKFECGFIVCVWAWPSSKKAPKISLQLLKQEGGLPPHVH